MKKTRSSWAWDFYNLTCGYTKHLCSGAGQGQRSSWWGGAFPFPEHITPLLSPALCKGCSGARGPLVFFCSSLGLPSRSGFFSLRPQCRAPHGVWMGQGGTYPVLSHTVPSSSPRQRWWHLRAAKHKRETRCQMLLQHPGTCQCPLPATHPAQCDGHAMMSREQWENCVDKPINFQVLPRVLA